MDTKLEKYLSRLVDNIESLEISRFYEVPIDVKYKNLNVVKFYSGDTFK